MSEPVHVKDVVSLEALYFSTIENIVYICFCIGN